MHKALNFCLRAEFCLNKFAIVHNRLWKPGRHKRVASLATLVSVATPFIAAVLLCSLQVTKGFRDLTLSQHLLVRQIIVVVRDASAPERRHDIAQGSATMASLARELCV